MTRHSLPADFSERLTRLRGAKILGVDMTTGGPDPRVDKIERIQFAAEGIPDLTVDCRTLPDEGFASLRELLSGDAVKVFLDAKTQLQFLLATRVNPRLLFDATLAGRLLYLPEQPQSFDAASLAANYLGENIAAAGPENASSDIVSAPGPRARLALRLREAMLRPIYENGLATVAEIEFKCVRAVAHMEAEHQSSFWAGHETTAHANYDSNAFILDLLRRNGIDVAATSKRDLLPYRGNPLVAALTRYRRAAKAISAFLRPMPGFIHPATGRLHPQYDQLTAFSGRMSCSNPNIQQIPRERTFRECFAAPPGRRLIIADYSQIELRVAAEISGDKRMLAAYRAGQDLHLLTASHLANKPAHLVSKQERKAVNLGLIYGMGAAGLQQTARQSYGVDMSLEDATLFRRKFFETYNGITLWHRRIKTDADRIGRTLTGRRFPYSSEAGLPERSNLPVQGTAADIIKKALGILAEKATGDAFAIVGVVHDEIMLECRKERAEATADTLRSAMEEAANAILPNFPTDVEPVIAGSWAGK